MKTARTLQEAQSAVDEWIRGTGAGYYPELTNLARFVEETGELARIFARKFGGLKAKAGDDISDAALEDEMGDVLFVLLCLANQTGVKMDDALTGVLNKYSVRDAGRHNPSNLPRGGTANERE